MDWLMVALRLPPSAELLVRMHLARARLRQVGLVDLALIFGARIAMASARYPG